VIDKFLGDAVLCIFEGVDSAQRAVACGVGMLATVKSFNAEENRTTGQAVQVGIGLHTGPVILGTIGSSERMDSTVLGLTVNLAKRLEEITRPLGVDMIISDQVAQRLQDRHNHSLRNLGEVWVKGALKPLTIYEVFDENPPELRNLKDRIKPIMAEGIELVRGGRLEAALTKFETLQTISPQDPPLRLLIKSLRSALEQGQGGRGSALLDLR
jgi:adenylate cyclase